MPSTRSDKKFQVKVWYDKLNKQLFRSNCMRHHLSMMFVTEKYVVGALEGFTDTKIKDILDKHLDRFIFMDSKRDQLEPIGFTITDEWWQKLAHFALEYNTSVSKIASALFAHCVSAWEMKDVLEHYGTKPNKPKRRKRDKKGRYMADDRLSDYR